MIHFFSAILLTILFVCSRIVEHEPNCTPIFAIVLLAGYYMKSRLVYLIPVFGMFISNCFLGHYDLSMTIAIYGSLLLPVFLSSRTDKLTSVYAYSFACPVVFFITTNFAVWYGSGWYEQTWQGLINCYYMAIPFFKNSLISSVCYTFILGSVADKVMHLALNQNIMWVRFPPLSLFGRRFGV